MNVFMLLRSELRRSAAVLAGIAAVLALSLSISIATGMTDRMLRHASAQAADRFDLLIGAKASPSSLLLGAVFLRDEPLPLVPLSVMKDLDERHGVKWVAPVAFGDRAGDSPIVGTTTSLVTFGGTVRPAEGRLFEAVVGASAPYRIGDEIVPMHGRTPGAGHAHDHGRLKVVGRMPESGTPWDRAVMIPIEAVWATHSMTVHDELERAHGHDHEEEDGTEHEEGHGRLLGVFSEHDFETLPGVSAVVVKPASFADAYRLRQQQSQRRRAYNCRAGGADKPAEVEIHYIFDYCYRVEREILLKVGNRHSKRAKREQEREKRQHAHGDAGDTQLCADK